MGNKSKKDDKYLLYINKNKTPGRSLKIFSFLVTILIVLVIVVVVVSNGESKYFLKELRVSSAVIMEKNNEEYNKYYIRLSPTNENSILLAIDDQWMQVNSDFYIKHQVNESIGILLGNYDVYKSNRFGKGQSYEKTKWSIDEVYDSIEAAQQANPYKKYTAKAALSKKKVTKNGNLFFVLSIEQRQLVTKVDKDIFDKYKEGQEVEGEFESIGDLTKLIRVVSI